MTREAIARKTLEALPRIIEYLQARKRYHRAAEQTF